MDWHGNIQHWRRRRARHRNLSAIYLSPNTENNIGVLLALGPSSFNERNCWAGALKESRSLGL